MEGFNAWRGEVQFRPKVAESRVDFLFFSAGLVLKDSVESAAVLEFTDDIVGVSGMDKFQ